MANRRIYIVTPYYTGKPHAVGSIHTPHALTQSAQVPAALLPQFTEDLGAAEGLAEHIVKSCPGVEVHVTQTISIYELPTTKLRVRKVNEKGEVLPA